MFRRANFGAFAAAWNVDNDHRGTASPDEVSSAVNTHCEPATLTVAVNSRGNRKARNDAVAVRSSDPMPRAINAQAAFVLA